MATQVEKGVFTASTSTGNQDITLSDSGLTPKAVVLWASYDTAEGITNGNGIFSIGMGTRDGGATQQVSVANFNQDNLGTSATVHDYNTSNLLRGITSDAIEATAIDYACTLVSFGAGTFRINWGNAPASAIKIHYWVLGGSDITAARVSAHTTSTAVATQNVTVNTGFGQPDLIMFLSHGYTSLFSQQDARLMVGFGKSDTERAAFIHTFEDASASMTLASWFRSDACMLFLGSGVTADAIVDLSARASWPTDGYQLAYDDQASLSFHFASLSIKGTFTSTIGTSSMLTSGSTQDLALASGTPKGAFFVANEVDLTSGTIDTTATDLGGYCVGATDGTNEGFAGQVDDDNNTTSRASRFHSESKVLARHIADAAGGAATLDAEADSSISGSNIRLTWGNLAAVAADYIYVIIGEPAASNIEITHVVGTLSITDDAPSIKAEMSHVVGTVSLSDDPPQPRLQMPPTIGSLSLTSNAHTPAVALQQAVGTVQLTSNEHTLVTGLIVEHIAGIVSLTSGTNQVSILILQQVHDLLTLVAGTHILTQDQAIQPPAGLLTLSGGVHEIVGAEEVEFIFEGTGPIRKYHPWVPPSFVQVMFNRVKTTTQTIRDVIKGD